MPEWLDAVRGHLPSRSRSPSLRRNAEKASIQASSLPAPAADNRPASTHHTSSASNVLTGTRRDASGPEFERVAGEPPAGSALPTNKPGSPQRDRLAGSPGGHIEENKHAKIQSFFIRSAPDGTPLAHAQDDLQKATEDLERVLEQSGRPSRKFSYLTQQLQGASDQPQEISLETLTETVQEHQHEKDQELGARVGQFMRNLYPVAKLALGLMGTAANYATCPPAQIVATGLAQVFDLAMKPSAQTALVKSGLATFCKDRSFLRNLQDLPSATAPEDLLLCATELQTALVSFLRISILWLAANAWAKLGKSIVDSTDVGSAVESLTSARNALLNSIVGETYFLLQHEKIKTERAELLRNICPDEFHSAQLERHSLIQNDRRKSNITSWVVDEDYLDAKLVHSSYYQSTHSSVDIVSNPYRNFRCGRTKALWCSGLPGAGKSYIASSIVDDLEQYAKYRDVGVAYVFCQVQYSKTSEQNLSSVLGAIIRQLVARKPDLCFHSKFKDKLDQKNLPEHLREQMIVDLCPEFSEVVIVIDALDEFSPNPDSRFEMLQKLRDFASHSDSGNFRFCVTSRPSDESWTQLNIRNPAGAWSDLVVLPIESINIEAQTKEITAWIEAFIKDPSHVRSGKLLSRDPKLEFDIIAKVTERSRGLFKLATLQVESCLSEGNPSRVRNRLNNLKTEIDDYYQDTLERALDPSRAESTRHHIRRLLQWLLYTHGDQTYGMLQFAVAIEDTDELASADLTTFAVNDLQEYIDLCEGLVTREGEDIYVGARVRFSHETARTFVEKQLGTTDEEGMEMVLRSYLAVISHEVLIDATRMDCEELGFYESRKSAIRALSRSATNKIDEVNDPNVEWHAAYHFWECALDWSMWMDWGRVEEVAYATQVKALLARVGLTALLFCSLGRISIEPTNLDRISFKPTNLGLSWIKVFKWLLKEGVDPNSRRGGGHAGGYALLHDAIRSESARGVSAGCVAALIDTTATDVNATFLSHGCATTPLALALINGNFTAAQLLCSRPDLYFTTGEDAESVLHFAVQATRSADGVQASEFLENFLKRRDIPDINLKARPWNFAIEAEDDYPLQEGKSYGFFANRNGSTALMLAAATGNEIAMQILLKQPHIDLQDVDSHGRTILMHAIFNYARFEHEDMTSDALRMIAEDPQVSIDAQDMRGRTACAWAALGGYEDPEAWTGNPKFISRDIRPLSAAPMALVLANHANCNIPDSDGNTPLDLAIMMQRILGNVLAAWKGLLEELRQARMIRQQIDSAGGSTAELGPPKSKWVQMILDYAGEPLDKEYEAVVKKVESVNKKAIDDIVDLLKKHGARGREDFEFDTPDFDSEIGDHWLRSELAEQNSSFQSQGDAPKRPTTWLYGLKLDE